MQQILLPAVSVQVAQTWQCALKIRVNSLTKAKTENVLNIENWECVGL